MVYMVCEPILVFSLSLGQAEQLFLIANRHPQSEMVPAPQNTLHHCVIPLLVLDFVFSLLFCEPPPFIYF